MAGITHSQLDDSMEKAPFTSGMSQAATFVFTSKAGSHGCSSPQIYIYIYLIFDLSQPYGLHGDLTFFTRKYSRTWQKCWGFHLWEIHVASDHAILLWFFQCQICLTWWTQIRELSVTIDLEYWWSMENPPISEAGLLGIGMSLALAFGNVWARVKIGKIR